MAFQNRAAFGNIYTIPTSTVDNIAKMVYQEQKQREQQKLQQDKALDDEFAKNVAGVKSVDIPDITKAYNDFKMARMELSRKGNKVTPQEQMDVMLKRGNVFSAINASKEDKERIKTRLADLKSNGKRYKPDAHNILSNLLNTRTAERTPENDDDVLYNVYSFPEMKTFTEGVLGKSSVKKIPLTTPSKKGELYDDKEVYNVYRNPNEMYNNAYLQAFSMPNKEGFINTMLDPKNLSDAEKEDLKNRYFAKINSPEFKKVYGEVQPFPESAGQTDLGKATALMVMGIVDKLPLTPTETVSEYNKERGDKKKRQEGMEDWLKKNRITFGQSMQKIAANKAAGNAQDDIGYISDEVVSENGIPLQSGKTFVNIKDVDPERLDIIINRDLSKKKMGVQPVTIKMKQPDGTLKEMQGYYVDPNTGDWEGKGGQKASREAARDRYVNRESPTKFKTQLGTKASENTKDQPKPSTEQSGYTRQELKGAGWTDDQIKKAIKAGKIKIRD